MKTIFEHYDKSLLAGLPRVMFQGRIEVVTDEDRARQAVGYLMSQSLLGFDTETRPSFRRGMLHKVALLQVSADDICFLFRLNLMGLPPCLIELLSDGKITKVGLSLHDDMHGLLARKEFCPGTFIDLQNIASRMGIADMSLQKLFANILGGRIAKSQQLSNWEAESLTEAQQRYAATDAWACIQLYREMTRLQQDGFKLEVAKPAEAPREV